MRPCKTTPREITVISINQRRRIGQEVYLSIKGDGRVNRSTAEKLIRNVVPSSLTLCCGKQHYMQYIPYLLFAQAHRFHAEGWQISPFEQIPPLHGCEPTTFSSSSSSHASLSSPTRRGEEEDPPRPPPLPIFSIHRRRTSPSSLPLKRILLSSPNGARS